MRNSPLSALVFGVLFLQAAPAFATTCKIMIHNGKEHRDPPGCVQTAAEEAGSAAVQAKLDKNGRIGAAKKKGSNDIHTASGKLGGITADGATASDTTQLDGLTPEVTATGAAGTGDKHAGHIAPAGGKPVETGALVERELVIADIQAAAAKAALSDRRFKDVIQASADGVIAAIRAGEPKIPATNVGSFEAMLRIQLDENRAVWQLGKNKELTPEQRAAEEAKIHAAADREMREKVKGMEVMDPFHDKFNQAWGEWKQRRADRDEWRSGLPNRDHIGGMLRSNPSSAANWTLDAQAKLEAGDKAGGRRSLDQAISNGGSADAHALRGALRLEEKDYDGAYQDAKKALELNPGDKNALGLLHSTEGRTSPGLAASLARGGSGGGSAGAGGAGGSAGYGGGFAAGGFGTRSPREIAGMTSAATLSSAQKLEEARRAMAVGDIQRAIALAQKALELDPKNASAHNFLSVLYARMKDYPRAIASASAGLALSPRDASLLNNKAFAENRAKLYRDALGSSNGAIEADSRNPYSYANRAHAYGGLGDRDSMMSDINRAAALDPRFEKTAADASQLQLPSNADMVFLFPGENPEAEGAAAAPSRSRSFGAVAAAGVLGGLLLALGLLSTVLAPIKESVVSAFTRATRRGPTLHELEAPVATREPASVAGNADGLIRGQYEISRQIGQGGMGMVYAGTDRSLGRPVAIKKMRDELRMNPRERERFIIEAKTVASLHHENIVDIYAIAEEGDDVYLVFEFVDGQTAHEAVQANGRLNVADSLRVTRAMADALAYAHSRGVIHRDVKPSNVMLTSDGRIKVMDFGIARMAKDALTRYSMTNSVVGTPPYMAPEQEQGVVRKESDVYSLAICAYEMLTGKLPFAGIGAGMLMNKINMTYVPPSRAIAGLPETLDEVFLKAFQADPEKRHRTPQEFAAALENAHGGVRGRA